MNDYGVRGVRGFEVLYKVHGRELMVVKPPNIKSMVGIMFKYCFRMAIEGIPISFLHPVAVVEIGRQEVGPWRLFEKWSQGWAWMAWRGRYISRQKHNKPSHKYMGGRRIPFRTEHIKAARQGFGWDGGVNISGVKCNKPSHKIQGQ